MYTGDVSELVVWVWHDAKISQSGYRRNRTIQYVASKPANSQRELEANFYPQRP